VAAANVSFSSARFGPMLEHQGCAPASCTVFTFGPSNVGSFSRWRGMTISREYLAHCEPGGDFDVVSPPGLSLSNLIIADDVWETACSNWAPTDPSRLLTSRRALKISPNALHRLRHWNEQAILEAKRTSPDVNNLICHIESYGPALLIRALFEGHAAANRPSYATDFIEENLPGIIRINDLVQAIGVSERTIEYAFREQYGLTPQAYMATRRLHLARQRLLLGDRKSTTIATVAMD